MSSWNVEKAKEEIERELNVLKLIIKPYGILYQNFIRSYGDTDRGLGKFLQLFSYLRDDAFEIFLANRASVSYFFPYVKEEITTILSRLGDGMKRVSQQIERAYEEGRALYPEDVVSLAIWTQNVRIYMDYSCGRDYVTLRLLEGENINRVLEKFKRNVESFLRKTLDSTSYLHLYMSDVITYAFITLFIIDAYDSSFLREIKATKNWKEKVRVLREYAPLRGLKEFCFILK